MKTTTQTSKVQPSNKDMLKAGVYVVSLFIVSVLVLAGADLIDQILLWIK